MSARTTIRSSLQLLDRRDRRLLAVAAAVQMTTSLLDLLGVALIGLAGVVSISVVAGQSLPTRVTALASAAGLGGLSESTLVSVLGAAAAALLLSKSVLSPLLMGRILRFLAGREAVVSARLTRELLSRPLTFVQSRSTQETYVALVRGAHAATVIVPGQMVMAVSDMALLLLLGVSLLVVNPAVACGAIGFFGVVGWGLQRRLGDRAAHFGRQRATADTASLRTVQETVGAYREIVVSNRRSFYIDRVRSLRTRAARAAAGLDLIGLLPKYVFEAALVIGAFTLAWTLFSTQPILIAAGTFAVFLAAATRVMPALLRIQSAALSIRAAAGLAAPTFALAEDLRRPMQTAPPVEASDAAARSLSHEYRDFRPCIELRDVTVAYPASRAPAISEINLSISEGQSVALVGPSGSGKSTLADVILGVLRPDNGYVTLSDTNPDSALIRWPGAVAYVPQSVMLVEDTLRANVALGVPPALIEDELVWDALSRAQLSEFARASPEGLDTQIGERGLRLSGGQQQRLGIARALLTRPRLLVLDEATSALDAETERAITTIFESLGDSVTLITIAHRLSTVQHADQVVYMEAGCIVATGSFGDVCSRVPALRNQAELMGLRPA